MTHYISFKTKLMEVDCDGATRLVVHYKKSISRSNITLRNHEHKYYNATFFEVILNKIYLQLIGNRAWEYVDNLPSHITIEGTGLIKTVKIEIPDEFYTNY